jgi:hypothetical protein
MSHAPNPRPTVCELYEGLTDPERALLTYEFTLARGIPASLALLRSVPYPLAEDTAAAVERLVRRYVYPWSDLRGRYLLPLVRDRLWREGADDLFASDCSAEDLAAKFDDPDDFRAFKRGTDFTYGLAGKRDAEVEEECDSLQRVLEAAAADGSFELGHSVPLPLPFGPPSLTRIPLVEGSWIDRHVVELAEWAAGLVRAGCRVLPALDPHRLAWHRVYPADTDWTAPNEADPAAVAAQRDRAAERLTRFPYRTREIDGRAHVRVEDYASWADRQVPGDLLDHRSPGVGVESWNHWIGAHSDDGRVDVFGDVVGAIAHPVALQGGRDYVVASGDALARARQLRSAALAELFATPCERISMTNPGDQFTPVQIDILRALRRRPWLSAHALAAEADVSRSRLFMAGGLKDLIERDPPLVIRGPQKRGYALSDVAPDVTRV